MFHTTSIYLIEAKEGAVLIIPLSAISIACFISSFLYKDTILDLGSVSRIRSFLKYFLSNFINLCEKQKQLYIAVIYSLMN